jgi:hypothetical protein
VIGASVAANYHREVLRPDTHFDVDARRSVLSYGRSNYVVTTPLALRKGWRSMSLSIQLGLYAVLIGSLAIGVLVRPALAITAVACVFGLKQWGQLTVPWLAQHSTFTNVATGCMVLAALAVQTCSAMPSSRCCGHRDRTWR